MDNKSWLIYYRSILLAIRAVLFETFSSPKLKRLVLFMGDSIEFVQDNSEEELQSYERAKILEKLPVSSVKKSSLFNQELIEYFEHYYLIKLKNKTLIIPFEWIVAIETELE